MDAANRQEFYRPVEDQPIGKEHWEHERSPVLTECEERLQVGNRGSVSCQKTSSATMAGRRSHARFARVAKPPMALPVGFAEMPKADVVSLRSPRRPRFPDCVFGAISNDAAMGEQDMPFGALELSSRPGLYRAHTTFLL